ncbi:response regulator transcription factor [Microbacterium sp. NEAU-LLC]|uniref:Response regulator transcription factor n=1 Tax=Microbacterium helvum TaxID=2773713 RepID=A0ABR8NSY3_9MICO|nr:response regulator transcription factor [Microbacterium helvum]MBD3943741.1 response regulator transcription factor [Microbacterium helvum]
MTRVMVVDDHPVYRQGIAALLAASGYDVVAQAGSAAESVEWMRRTKPDAVLMDLGLPDGSGVDATARIVGERPQTRVVVVTMFDDDGSVRRALAAGAAGYVVKDAAPSEILAALAAALEGATVLGSGVARVADAGLRSEPTRDPYGLTPRERDVLSLVARGLTNRQTAERLGIAGKTVANVVSVLLAKCGVADRIELAAIGRSLGE